MHLKQGRQAELAGERQQIGQFIILEAGGNQQQRVRPGYFGFIHLVRVNDEILAQNRHRSIEAAAFRLKRGLNLGDKIQIALKKAGVCQHADGRCAILGVGGCQFHRVELGAQQALAGRSFFHFGNQGHAPGVFQRGDKIAGGRGKNCLRP